MHSALLRCYPCVIHWSTAKYFCILTVMFLNQTSYSRGITILFRNEEESAAFHCVVQQWKKELNFQGAALEICVNHVVKWPLLHDIVPNCALARTFSVYSCFHLYLNAGRIFYIKKE